MSDLEQIEHFSNKEFNYLTDIIEKKDVVKINSFIKNINQQDLQNLLSYLPRSVRFHFFLIITDKTAAHLISAMPSKYIINEILYGLPKKRSATIIKLLPSNIKVDILKNFAPKFKTNILSYFNKTEKEEIQNIILYANDSAGGLMITEYLEYPISYTANDVKEDLEKNSQIYNNYDIQYAYITDKDKKLLGIVSLRDLLFAEKNKPLNKLLKKGVISILANTNLKEVKNYFEEHSYLAFPVINSSGKILGILKRDSVNEFIHTETEQEILKLTGITGGEEFRSMPIHKRSIKRLSWLTINILLNFMAASIIIVYQDTLMQAIALAVFLPIISDMSGCSGNQSVAVTLREISLGLIKPKEILRVLLKEFSLGLINGIILGIIIASIAFIWKGNIYLGLIVGIAMTLNTILAVCLGSALPIILKALKIDPAIASSPLLTTITDMMGFFLIFILASQFLQHII